MSGTEDGFLWRAPGDMVPRMAFLSLRTGLKAYFSTYHSMRSTITKYLEAEPFETVERKKNRIIESHTLLYRECQLEAIVHLQHFFELIIKDLLESRHKLLVTNLEAQPILLDRLLRGEVISEEELAEQKTLEFRESLGRFIDLQNAGRLDPEYQFLMDASGILYQLNIYRNRMWHRGSLVLFYDKLDSFIGKGILWVIVKIINLSRYAKMSNDIAQTWRYKDPACGRDPINEIVKECAKPIPSRNKIAYLKEMGRASYALMERGFTHVGVERQGEDFIRQLDADIDGPSASITQCPVCANKTYAIYASYGWAVCAYCGFNVDDQINALSMNRDFFPIEDENHDDQAS